ncbi:PaaI family thioesterase [Gordonia terrae]|uniref:PaaI family thioesterase n=1 Tax=Gordonia terrae TaxID=2055 RepID=UPI003F6D8F4C
MAGAETLLDISAIAMSTEVAELAMAATSRLADPRAGVARGALGVPLDDATGYVIAAATPVGKWPVSLGIRMDFLADPPLGGNPLAVVGELIGRDDRGGTTRGEVRDDTGRVVALITQRSHLIPLPHRPTGGTLAREVPPAGVTVRDALGVRESGPGVVDLRPNPLAANGMGNVHGGILICGAEFAAMSAVDARGDLRTTSIDIAYLRPADSAGTTTFRSEVQHRGRSLAVVAVTAQNSAGKPCAVATVIIQS